MSKKSKPNEGDLRVWWIPQIPMKSFYVSVRNIREAVLVLNTLADYDLFQFDYNIKPDYCNIGGLEVFEEGEWGTWYDEETGSDCNDRPRLEELTS